jgi:hypothetical protein
MALFSGTYLDKKTAFLLPVGAMLISDFFIGFDSLASRLTVYGSFILITLIGFWLKSHKNFGNMVLASLCASVLFFVITNFGVWVAGGLYSKDWTGLLACYSAAVPFFRNTLAGDFFYTGVFFGGFELIRAVSQGKALAWLKLERGKSG